MSSKKIMVLGSYGNFGKRIVKRLANEDVELMLCGRDRQKIEVLISEVTHNQAKLSSYVFNIQNELKKYLQQLQPDLVINTCGPFQFCNYTIPKACIEYQINYIDLADARDYVNRITLLDEQARTKSCFVITGASTLPTLSSAVIEYFLKNFLKLEEVSYGISPGQKTERGLATVKAIMSYLGKPIKPYAKFDKDLYGWQSLHRVYYPTLGYRLMGNCDIPDFDIFPEYYNLDSLHFSAGMESKTLHILMWLLSWGIRFGLPIHLTNYANILLKVSHCFDFLGTADGGMHMFLKGLNHQGEPLNVDWHLIAYDGCGPEIPCIPAVILAKKFLHQQIKFVGALPCMSLISLSEYMEELAGFPIEIIEKWN